jgi:hypothetical protein
VLCKACVDDLENCLDRESRSKSAFQLEAGNCKDLPSISSSLSSSIPIFFLVGTKEFCQASFLKVVIAKTLKALYYHLVPQHQSTTGASSRSHSREAHHLDPSFDSVCSYPHSQA